MPGKWLMQEVAAVAGKDAASYTCSLSEYVGYTPIAVRFTLTLGGSTTYISMQMQSLNSLTSTYQNILNSNGAWACGVSTAANLNDMRTQGQAAALPVRWPLPADSRLYVDVGGVATGAQVYIHLFLAKPFGG